MVSVGANFQGEGGNRHGAGHGGGTSDFKLSTTEAHHPLVFSPPNSCHVIDDQGMRRKHSLKEGLWGWRDRTVWRALALHSADLGLVLDIPPSTIKIDS